MSPTTQFVDPDSRPRRDAPTPDGERPLRLLLLAQRLEAPSFRYRFGALAESLARRGLAECTVRQVPRHPEWIRVARLARELRRSDVVLVSKFKLLAGERAFVTSLCPAVVWDLDDAVMIERPGVDAAAEEPSWWRRQRFDRMIGASRLVVAGSRSLAAMIGPRPTPVVVWPTPVDLASFPEAEHPERPLLRLVWVGVGSNVRYLASLEPALREFDRRKIPWELVVLSDRRPPMPGLPVRLEPWSEEGAKSILASADIGLAPLPDDGWTRGKAAFRCVEYAAAGIPCIASPSGAQQEVVVAGETGLFAKEPGDWVAAIAMLARSRDLRRRLGAQARARAAELYDIERIAPRYHGWLRDLVSPSRSPGAPDLVAG